MPDIVRKAAVLLLNFQECPCIGNGSLYFQAVSYDAGITPQCFQLVLSEDADFINKSSSGVYKGYGVEYLNKISQYTGWRYEYINESWENQLADLKSGKVDLICNAQKTEAREDSVF